MTAPKPPEKKPTNYKLAWAETKALMWTHRRTLGIGFALMLLSRAAGFVGPMSTKWLVDDVVGKQRFDLLWPLALAVGGAALVQAATSFALSQVISVAGQRAITELRRRVHARLLRLPVGDERPLRDLQGRPEPGRLHHRRRHAGRPDRQVVRPEQPVQDHLPARPGVHHSADVRRRRTDVG